MQNLSKQRRHASSPRPANPRPAASSFIETILRLQAITLTTAALYRGSASFVKIVSPAFLLRPLCFAATMSTSADLSTSLQVKKLSPSATIPTRGSPLSAGFDLSANEKKVCKTNSFSILIIPSTTVLCAFGVALATSYLFDTITFIMLDVLNFGGI
jgi:hypothetical protein